jgi:hypothetical protein
MYNDTATNTHGGRNARPTTRTKANSISQMEVPRVRYKDSNTGCVDVSSDVHKPRQASEEISCDGDPMSRLLRKLVVAVFAIVTGAFMAMFMIEQRRWKRRRDEHAEHLSTLLGTVYPHGHDERKKF